MAALGSGRLRHSGAGGEVLLSRNEPWTKGGVTVRLRQVRLKTKYWSLYPMIESGIWHGAHALVGRVLLQHRGRPTFASLLDRPLPDAHFDFRYGDPARPPREAAQRSRWNDRT